MLRLNKTSKSSSSSPDTTKPNSSFTMNYESNDCDNQRRKRVIMEPFYTFGYKHHLSRRGHNSPFLKYEQSVKESIYRSKSSNFYNTRSLSPVLFKRLLLSQEKNLNKINSNTNNEAEKNEDKRLAYPSMSKDFVVTRMYLQTPQLKSTNFICYKQRYFVDLVTQNSTAATRRKWDKLELCERCKSLIQLNEIMSRRKMVRFEKCEDDEKDDENDKYKLVRMPLKYSLDDLSVDTNDDTCHVSRRKLRLTRLIRKYEANNNLNLVIKSQSNDSAIVKLIKQDENELKYFLNAVRRSPRSERKEFLNELRSHPLIRKNDYLDY